MDIDGASKIYNIGRKRGSKDGGGREGIAIGYRRNRRRLRVGKRKGWIVGRKAEFIGGGRIK